MKRYGNFWDNIVTKSNILLSYLNAKVGKRKKRNVRRFYKNWRENLDKIQHSLKFFTFKTGQYNSKELYEPKKRVIYILPFNPDRIVQHAVMNEIKKIWNKIFISDSYACRDKKGMHRGSNKVRGWVKINKYCLKMDVRKFYLNINHEILKTIIRKKLKDIYLLKVFDNIIDSFPGEINVPIGNFTSQWFGNLYMNELDYYVKHTLHCKYYIRYCDDFCLFSNNKQQLHDWSALIKQFLKDKLQLELSKNDVFPVTRGVDFLGYRHFPNKVLVRKRTIKKFKKIFRKIAKKIQEDNYNNYTYILGFLNSSKGWLDHANTHRFKERWKIEELIKLLRVCEYSKFKKLFIYVANIPAKTYIINDERINEIIQEARSIKINKTQTMKKSIKIDISKLKNFQYTPYAEPGDWMNLSEQFKINTFNDMECENLFLKELDMNSELKKEIVSLSDLIGASKIKYPTIKLEEIIDIDVLIHSMYIAPSIKSEGKDYARFIITKLDSDEKLTFTTESVSVVDSVKRVLAKFDSLNISEESRPLIKSRFVYEFSKKSGRRYIKMISL